MRCIEMGQSLLDCPCLLVSNVPMRIET